MTRMGWRSEMPVDDETGLEPEMRIWRMTSKNRLCITIETIEVCLRTSKPVSWCILESYLVVTDQVSIMCRDEFRLSQVKLYHSDAKDFIRSLWLPAALVTAYRCVFSAYCLGWIIYSGFHPANGAEKWFIYLTNWAFTFVTMYFLWASVVSVLHHFGITNNQVDMQMKAIGNHDSDAEGGEGLGDSVHKSAVKMSWYHKGLWVVFNIAANTAIMVTLLYWTLIFGGTTSGLDVSTHLINSVMIVADIMLSCVPVRILHVVYPLVLGICYLLTTVIFWAVDATNARGEPYIYSYIDYNNSPGFSIGLVCGFILVGQPVVQSLLFGLYKLRCFLGLKCGNKS